VGGVSPSSGVSHLPAGENQNQTPARRRYGEGVAPKSSGCSRASANTDETASQPPQDASGCARTAAGHTCRPRSGAGPLARSCAIVSDLVRGLAGNTTVMCHIRLHPSGTLHPTPRHAFRPPSSTHPSFVATTCAASHSASADVLLKRGKPTPTPPNCQGVNPQLTATQHLPPWRRITHNTLQAPDTPLKRSSWHTRYSGSGVLHIAPPDPRGGAK